MIRCGSLNSTETTLSDPSDVNGRAISTLRSVETHLSDHFFVSSNNTLVLWLFFAWSMKRAVLKLLFLCKSHVLTNVNTKNRILKLELCDFSEKKSVLSRIRTGDLRFCAIFDKEFLHLLLFVVV